MSTPKLGRWFNRQWTWKRRTARRMLRGAGRSGRRGIFGGRRRRRASSPAAIVVTIVFVVFSVMFSSDDSDNNDEDVASQLEAVEEAQERTPKGDRAPGAAPAQQRAVDQAPSGDEAAERGGAFGR